MLSWFKSFFDWLLCLLKNFFGWVLDKITDIVTSATEVVLSMLPNTPFNFEPIVWGDFGKIIGYVLPITKILQHFSVILVAVSVYYVVRQMLRILKTIN